MDRSRQKQGSKPLQTFELATAVAAKLYGVNAYDPPGVEAGKIAAFRLLGKKA